MSLRVRDFTPDDYQAISRIENRVYPEYPGTPEEMRYDDEHRDPKCRWRRWVADWSGAPVGHSGYSQWAGMYHPRRFSLHASVLPEFRRRGIGAVLYDTVLQGLAGFDPLSVRSYAREDMPDSLRFLERRGFAESQREWESRLDVGAFDFGPWEEAERRIDAFGIEIRTLRELEADPERDRKWYELEWQIMLDVPHPEPQTRPDFDPWISRKHSNPNLLPDGYFLAVHQGDYVGLSALWASQSSRELYTGLTGVHRDYRRKGIALALKLRALRFAREYGAPVVKTWNEQNNRAMLSINEALGFVKQPAWIDFVRVLKQE